MTKFEMSIANFNLTYGKEERPMLEQFTDLVYPAFCSDIIRTYENSNYFFMNTELIDTVNGLALKGILVNNTEVDINSKYNSKTRKLSSANEVYSSAPYSLFYIFLKNHRMIYVKNQKVSPLLGTFNQTAKYVLHQFRKNENEKRKKMRQELLPDFNLNVMGIPSSNDLMTELNKVEKISKLNLRFYPLNGEDIHETSEVTQRLLQSMYESRKFSGSKTGNASFNSPKDKENVAKMVSEVGGTADATIEAKSRDGSSIKIKTNNVSQKLRLVTEDESNQITEHESEVLKKATSIPEITRVSDRNSEIYKKLKNSLKALLKHD